MPDRLVGALLLLFGVWVTVFARNSARTNMRFQDYWVQHRSARVRKQYEMSPAKRQARLDLLTIVYSVAGVVLAVCGLLVLIGVLESHGP
jgi:hypothetical protein